MAPIYFESPEIVSVRALWLIRVGKRILGHTEIHWLVGRPDMVWDVEKGTIEIEATLEWQVK